MKKILTIDPATTSGIAWNIEKTAYVFKHKCSPNELYDVIFYLNLINNFDEFYIEKFNFFSGKTGSIPISSLLKRIGYLTYRLLENKIELKELNITSCRKKIGFEGKDNNKKKVFSYFNMIDERINSDCADALTLLFSNFENWKEMKIIYYDYK